MKRLGAKHLSPFVSGFLATLIFHQGLAMVLYTIQVLPNPAFNLTPTEPLGVPSVISLAFFGGLWGILIWLAIGKMNRYRQLGAAVVLGAIGPTAVAFLVVFPLKGIDVPLAAFPIGLLLNGFWGLGLWRLMQLLMRFRST